MIRVIFQIKKSHNIMFRMYSLDIKINKILDSNNIQIPKIVDNFQKNQSTIKTKNYFSQINNIHNNQNNIKKSYLDNKNNFYQSDKMIG